MMSMEIYSWKQKSLQQQVADQIFSESRIVTDISVNESMVTSNGLVVLGAEVVFPFEGPPYPPVLQWAEQAGQAFPSPIAMFIHGKYGLWHAFQFALQKPLMGIDIKLMTALPTWPAMSAQIADNTAAWRVRLALSAWNINTRTLMRSFTWKLSWPPVTADNFCPVTVTTGLKPDFYPAI